MYYRLKAGVLALHEESESSRKVFVRLTEGMIVHLQSPVGQSGLVDVEREGTRFTVFYSDLIDASFPPVPDQDTGPVN